MENFGLLKLLFSALSNDGQSPASPDSFKREEGKPLSHQTSPIQPPNDFSPNPTDSPRFKTDEPPTEQSADRTSTAALLALFKDHDERAKRIEQTHQKPTSK